MRCRFALVAPLAMIASCYDAPRPACGFWCGPAGECPSGYQCDFGEGRCFANGFDPIDNEMLCPDAGARPVRPDTRRPSIDYVDPGCDGPGIVTSLNCLRVGFDESVINVRTSTLYVRDPGGSTLPDPVITVVDDGFQLYADLDYPIQFAIGQFYTLTASDEIRDVAGNRLVADDMEFSFESFQPPNFITNRIPAPGEIGVGVDVDVFVTYNDFYPLDQFNFRLAEVFGNEVLADVFQTSDISARLDPIDQLLANREYIVTAPLQSANWVFTTGPDLVGPRLRFTFPFSSQDNVPVTEPISITLDEPVQAITTANFVVTFNDTMTVTGTITSAEGQRTWIFTPSTSLMPSTTYSVQVSSVDAAGNPGVAMWSFTTAP